MNAPQYIQGNIQSGIYRTERIAKVSGMDVSAIRIILSINVFLQFQA